MTIARVVEDVLSAVEPTGEAVVQRWMIRLQIGLRRVTRHPLISVTAMFFVACLTLSYMMYWFEQENGLPYDSYLTTLKNIIPVLIISGMDVPQPHSFGGLVVSYLLMIVGILYIALFTAVVTTDLVQTQLSRGITMGKIKFEDHILICGWVKRSRAILDQLFSPDLQEIHPVVIVASDIEEPPMDHPCLKIVRGDPTDEAVLIRANARHARTAIILANHEDCDAGVSDARNLLIALAVEHLQPEIYSCVEVIDPSNIVHFRRVNVDEIISVTEIGNQLLVQAAVCPGASRLVADMLTFGEGEEVYQAGVPQPFVGKSFADLAATLAKEHDMVLVGVSSGGQIVNSHRSRWIFKPGDTIFVLAEDEPGNMQDIQFADYVADKPAS